MEQKYLLISRHDASISGILRHSYLRDPTNGASQVICTVGKSTSLCTFRTWAFEAKLWIFELSRELVQLKSVDSISALFLCSISFSKASLASFTNHRTSITMHRWDFRIPLLYQFRSRNERQQKTNGVEHHFNDCNKSGRWVLDHFAFCQRIDWFWPCNGSNPAQKIWQLLMVYCEAIPDQLTHYHSSCGKQTIQSLQNSNLICRVYS